MSDPVIEAAQADVTRFLREEIANNIMEGDELAPVAISEWRVDMNGVRRLAVVRFSEGGTLIVSAWWSADHGPGVQSLLISTRHEVAWLSKVMQ